MSESDLWKAVKKGLEDAADLHIDLMRLENLVGEGMADVNGCRKGAEFWLELKHRDELPKRECTAVFPDGIGLRDSQVIWLYKRAKHGGRCYVLGKAGKEIFLVHGRHCRVFNSLGYLELVEKCEWHYCGRGRVDWVGLLQILTGG
jgi:hypothetical protein